ncbi:MAG: YigZ family protein [Anaerolineae bacterium]|nr:YigZ family protein [Anaerolineae bacterium]
MTSEKKKQCLIPAKPASAEIKISNSRFIANAAPVFSVLQAKRFITTTKQNYTHASHNVPIFLIGHGTSVIAHSSDDGEPSGTAGRPALTVLQGSGIGDVAVVITRYFGGTKLGTGGLVRAYSDAVRGVLKVLPLAEKITAYTIKICTPYPYFDKVRHLIDAHGGTIENEDFSIEITITCLFRMENFPAFQSALTELSRGSIGASIISKNPSATMPLQN